MAPNMGENNALPVGTIAGGYVSRAILEERALRALQYPGCTLVLRGPPLCGKNYLLRHVSSLVREEDAQQGLQTRSLHIHLGDIESEMFGSIGTLLGRIAAQLEQDVNEDRPDDAETGLPPVYNDPLAEGTPRFRKLRTTLANLVPNPELARMWTRDAGLPEMSIDFQGPVELVWDCILHAALNQGPAGVRGLLFEAIDRYPNDPVLVQEWATLQHLQADAQDLVPPKDRLWRLVKEQLQLSGSGRLLLVIKRLDRLAGTGLEHEFFRMLRSKLDNYDHEPWSRLRLIVLTSRRWGERCIDTSDFFNRADILKIEPFNASETESHVRLFGPAWSAAEIKRLRDRVGGHPHLECLVLEKALEGIDTETLFNLDYLENEVCGSHLNERRLWMEREGLLKDLCAALQCPPQPISEDAFNLLKEGYILSSRDCKLQSDLLAYYFGRRCKCLP